MRYIVNENNTCGQASLTDELRNSLLESLGFVNPKSEENLTESVKTQEPEVDETEVALYEWDGSIFAVEDEVYEIEGELFLRSFELDSDVAMEINESHYDMFVENVSFQDTEYILGDVYDYEDETFIKLNEAYSEKRMQQVIAKIRANDASGIPPGTPAPSLQGTFPDELDKNPSLEKDVDKVTKGVKPASKKAAKKAAGAHGDIKESEDPSKPVDPSTTANKKRYGRRLVIWSKAKQDRVAAAGAAGREAREAAKKRNQTNSSGDQSDSSTDTSN